MCHLSFLPPCILGFLGKLLPHYASENCIRLFAFDRCFVTVAFCRPICDNCGVFNSLFFPFWMCRTWLMTWNQSLVESFRMPPLLWWRFRNFTMLLLFTMPCRWVLQWPWCLHCCSVLIYRLSKHTCLFNISLNREICANRPHSR